MVKSASLTPTRWWTDALCKGAPLWLFYGGPRERQPMKGAREAAAIAFCQACPVRVDCFEDALADTPSQQHGVRGGATADERRRERHNRSRRKEAA